MPRRHTHHHQPRRSPLDRILLLAIVALLFLPHPVRAGQGNQLVLTDGSRTTATLIEFDDNAKSTTWRFVDATGEPIESNVVSQLVRWGNPAKAQRAATLILRDGSTLITDRTWSASGYARVDEETVGLNRRNGWTTVKRSETDWLLLEAAVEGTSKEELLRSETDNPNENDMIWLVGGDQIEGEVLSMKNDTVSILLGETATPTEVPISRVRAIRFASPSKERQQEPACLVGLDDGSLLVARSVHIAGQQASLQSVAGLHLEIEAESVLFLQLLGAHRKVSSGQESPKNPTTSRRAIKYLSSLEADDYRSTPYFDLAWPYARDVSLNGTPLQVQGHIYAKGIALHSAARLVYQLDKHQALRFQAEIAIADSTPSVGSVVFRVYVIRDGEVKPVYKSPIVRGGDAPLPIDVDLAGATTLVLVVDYADNGDTGDQALWLDARLVNDG